MTGINHTILINKTTGCLIGFSEPTPDPEATKARIFPMMAELEPGKKCIQLGKEKGELEKQRKIIVKNLAVALSKKRKPEVEKYTTERQSIDAAIKIKESEILPYAQELEKERRRLAVEFKVCSHPGPGEYPVTDEIYDKLKTVIDELNPGENIKIIAEKIKEGYNIGYEIINPELPEESKEIT